MHVTWLIHMRDITHPYMWRASFICEMTHPYMWHDSSTYMTRPVLICDMTHPYMWHDSPLYVTWRIHIYEWLIPLCDMTHTFVYITHSYMWHDSFICVTWLILTCDMTHPYMWHDSTICDMTHSHVRHTMLWKCRKTIAFQKVNIRVRIHLAEILKSHQILLHIYCIKSLQTPPLLYSPLLRAPVPRIKIK